MPDYHFQLQSTGPSASEQELVTAQDDEEARTLAEMRLLLGASFSVVTVSREGMEPFRLLRDRGPNMHVASRTAAPSSTLSRTRGQQPG